MLGSYLPSSTLLPQLDLLIRTSGERRVSNFFLWEVAYAELYFSPVMWPDFGESDLWTALHEYGKRERRFGLTSDQLSGAGTQHSPPASRIASLEALDGLGDPMPEPG
jgi:undecaprenyl diphosphate synthase